MSDEKKKERRKKIRKQMSLDSSQVDEKGYPSSKLTRQSTVSTSTSTSTSTSSSTAEKTSKASKAQKTSSISAAPPPPKSQPPEPRSQPPPSRSSSSNRGALLGSIEGFSKGKLRKSVCYDRSGPIL